MFIHRCPVGRFDALPGESNKEKNISVLTRARGIPNGIAGTACCNYNA